ncbi:MAG: hypothetical protein ACLFQB_08235 [Chitinispirillaceae bacterium]
MEIPSTADILLIAGYVGFCLGLNVIAFLISSFYKRKLKQPAPTLGFLLALLFGAIFIGTLIKRNFHFQSLTTISLLGYSMSSTLSIVGLYLSMRKTRK